LRESKTVKPNRIKFSIEMVLIGYWPLNEDSDAAEAKDYSGNENHGTINDGGDSAVPGATGILGQKAYSFDGSNDAVKISNDVGLSGPVTFSFWIKPDNFTQNGKIVYWFNSDGSQGWHPQINNEELGFLYWDGSEYQVSDSSPPSAGQWIHFVGTWDGSVMEAYTNGVLKARSSFSVTQSSSGTDIWIAKHGNADGNYFDGKISEVRVYNHALTPAEIQYLYQVGKRGRQVTSNKSS
jgi:hypothetical protein